MIHDTLNNNIYLIIFNYLNIEHNTLINDI